MLLFTASLIHPDLPFYRFSVQKSKWHQKKPLPRENSGYLNNIGNAHIMGDPGAFGFFRPGNMSTVTQFSSLKSYLWLMFTACTYIMILLLLLVRDVVFPLKCIAYQYSGGKQWQTTPKKNLPRMQRIRATPVAWLNSGLCPDRPNGWIPIIII